MTDQKVAGKYDPIEVITLRTGYFGNKMYHEGEKFSVYDFRGKDAGENRKTSASLLGSWMKRLDGGVNPSEDKMKRALRRDYNLGLKSAPATSIEEVQPRALSEGPIVDGHTKIVAPSIGAITPKPIVVPPVQPEVPTVPLVPTSPLMPTTPVMPVDKPMSEGPANLV